MPVIKVWGLPANQSEDNLRILHGSIVAAVVELKELGLYSENDMTVLFPPDRMSYGLGDEIIVEIDGLFQRRERTDDVIRRLAKEVGSTISFLYPQAKVECFVQTCYEDRGFWQSSTPR
ncbi:MAG: hypothetical protein V1704_00015 [Candidatus Vogelbacteria bacterium]